MKHASGRVTVRSWPSNANRTAARRCRPPRVCMCGSQVADCSHHPTINFVYDDCSWNVLQKWYLNLNIKNSSADYETYHPRSIMCIQEEDIFFIKALSQKGGMAVAADEHLVSAAPRRIMLLIFWRNAEQWRIAETDRTDRTLTRSEFRSAIQLSRATGDFKIRGKVTYLG